MAYGVIPIIASIILVIHHIALSDAPRGSKLSVGIAVAASLVIWQYYPRWLIFATLIQVGASVYMLVYMKVEKSTRG